MTPLAPKLQGRPKVENGLLCTYISIKQINETFIQRDKVFIYINDSIVIQILCSFPNNTWTLRIY